MDGSRQPHQPHGDAASAGGEKKKRRILRIRKWRRGKHKRAGRRGKGLKKGSSSSSSVGGFVLYKSFNDLLPQKVNSVHVHVEKVLLRLSKLRGSAAERDAMLKANPHHHLLTSVTLNNIVMHHYYKHAFGAPIPHTEAHAGFWQSHAVWAEQLAPSSIYEHLDHVRVSTTALSVRRILVVVDATPIKATSSAPATLTGDHEHGDTGPRPRVVLVQPCEACGQQPMLCAALVSFSEPPSGAKAVLGAPSPNMKLPPPQQFVRLSHTKVVADPAACFEIGRFFAESVDPSGSKGEESGGGDKPDASDAATAADAAARGKKSRKQSTTGKDASSTGDGEGGASQAAMLMAECRGIEVQLPPVLACAKEPERSIFVTANVERVVVTNTPTTCEDSAGLVRTKQFYNGWLYRRAHCFPESEIGTAFLPDVTEIAGVVQEPLLLDDGAVDEAAANAGTGMYVVVDGLSAVVNESRNGRKKRISDVLNRMSLIVRQRVSEDASFLLVECPHQVYISLTHDLYVYAMNMVNIVSALPFHIITEALQHVGPNSDDSSSDSDAGEKELPSHKYVLIRAMTFAVNNGSDDLIHACAYDTQLSLTQHPKYQLLRGSVQELVLTQNLSSASGAIVRENTPRAAVHIDADTIDIGHIVEPQVLIKVRIPQVPCDAAKAQYAAFRQRYEQARRAQHHLARSWADSVRRGTSVDPAKMKKALELMDKEDAGSTAAAAAAEAGRRARRARELQLLQGSGDQGAGGDEDGDGDGDDGDAVSLSSSASSEDGRSFVGSEDFAIEDRVCEHSWQQAELWTGEGDSQHEQHILDNVDAFLSSAYAAVFACASQEVVPLPSPRELTTGEVLQFIPEHELEPIVVEARVRWLKATLDRVPLQDIGEVFSHSNTDPLDAFPPSTCGPRIDLQLSDLDLTVLDGEYLQRLPLFAKTARAALVAEAQRSIRAPHVRVAVAPEGTVAIDLTEGGGTGRAGVRGQAAEEEEEEVVRLRRELACARDELASARAKLEQCAQAMAFSAKVVDGAKAQAEATLEEFNETVNADNDARRGRLADTSIRAKLQELIASSPDATI